MRFVVIVVARMHESRFVSPAKASKVLGVCHATLRVWASNGKIRYIQNGFKGTRRYDLSSVIRDADDSPESTARIDIIYARVSTRKQQHFLGNQSSALVAKFGEDCTVITDIGSGLNFKRPGLNKILEKVVRGQVRKLYVSHKDRLCRFAFDLVDFICTRHGTEIVVAEDGDTKPAECELAEDVLSIITVLGARLYGSRGHGKRKAGADGAQSTLEGAVAEL